MPSPRLNDVVLTSSERSWSGSWNENRWEYPETWIRPEMRLRLTTIALRPFYAVIREAVLPLGVSKFILSGGRTSAS